MGREIRRVPLDFSWPLNERWKGFLRPEYRPCPLGCKQGQTNAGWWLDSLAQLLVLVGNQAVEPESERNDPTRRTYPHPYLTQGFAQAPHFDGKLLPLDGCEQFIEGLMKYNKKARNTFERFNAFDMFRALERAAKLPKDWCVCKGCAGHGIHPDDLAASEAWEGTPPPLGEGWQLWETVSEGSPISPVFATEESFVKYLVRQGHSAESARAFCKQGWAFTEVITDGVVRMGIDSVQETK